MTDFNVKVEYIIAGVTGGKEIDWVWTRRLTGEVLSAKRKTFLSQTHDLNNEEDVSIHSRK